MAQDAHDGHRRRLARHCPLKPEITMRSLVVRRCQDGLIRENWVLVEILHVYRQLGADVFARLREFNKPARYAAGINSCLNSAGRPSKNSCFTRKLPRAGQCRLQIGPRQIPAEPVGLRRVEPLIGERLIPGLAAITCGSRFPGSSHAVLPGGPPLFLQTQRDLRTRPRNELTCLRASDQIRH